MAKLTLYNIRVCVVVSLAGFSYGFGSSVFPTSVGQPGFYAYYKLDPSSLRTARILSAINALNFFGCAVGAFVQSFVSDRLGRKGGLAVAALVACFGGALVAGSVAIPMLFVMRLIQAIGLGMLLTLVTLYLAEVAPPRHRGFLTGLAQFSTGIGYMTCGWGSVGSFHATNLTLSWRLPLALACVGPLAMLAGLFFIPESPRYLVWKDKREEAWMVIKRLHHDPANPSDADATAEFTQIVRQVELDKEENPTFWKMFTKPSWRRRSISVIFLLFAQQACGVHGIANFFSPIMISLGLTGDLPLILYALFILVSLIAIWIFMWLADMVGRRQLLLIGFTATACTLFAEALLQWKYLHSTSKAGKAACVLFVFLYVAIFQCIDAPTFIWAAEVFPTNLRAKGVCLALCAYFIGAITFSTPAPVALQTVKWGLFLIYAGFSVITLILVYFYIPETKGLPVEELGALFGDEVAVHLTPDGLGIVEDKPGVEQVEDNAAIEMVPT